MDFEMQLHNEDSNSCSAKKKKKLNRNTKALLGNNNTNHEGDSLMQDVLLQKDSIVESIANVNRGVGLQEVASEITTAPFRIEAPVVESIKPVSQKDSCVEPTMNLSSNSGLIEVQSNFYLNFLENKRIKRARKKIFKALKAYNTDVDLHKVASETKTAPFRIEAHVDKCIKLVSESTPLEVEVPDDLSKKMDFVATSVEIEAETDPLPSYLKILQKRKMRRVKRKQGRNSLGHEAIDHVHPEDNSVTKNTVLEKDTSSLPSANMFSDLLQEVASETTTAPFRIEAPVDESIKPVSEKDSCVESTTNLEKDTSSLPSANMFSDHLQEVASETTTAPFRIEAPVDKSIKPVSEKDSCVEPTTNLSYNSGLIEVQSNFYLNFLENKRIKRSRKKIFKALKAYNTDVDLHKVASETKTAPFRIEAPVDECIKVVSESTPLEVEIPDDLSKKMDSVATSVEIEAETDPLPPYLKILQKRKMRRVKRKQGRNSLGHEAIDHVHPEDNSVTKNTVLEKDTSSLSSANMFSEKQPK